MNTESRPYSDDNPNHLRRSPRGRGADDAVEELNFDDENPPRTGEPEVHASSPADKQLRAARADEIGGGIGKDEAEFARDEHPGP